ncbi:MAG TPA: hypothetical protein ENH46_00260 [Candidatus Pacearchaeota archaeon]|nr:hypothetical protein [Candidatus Pacearchaeota archaeon]
MERKKLEKIVNGRNVIDLLKEVDDYLARRSPGGAKIHDMNGLRNAIIANRELLEVLNLEKVSFGSLKDKDKISYRDINTLLLQSINNYNYKI